MKTYRADLHIHTVLSPCGDLDMSPVNIIERAKEKQLDIIGIADHNSTKNCKVIRELGKQQGLYVLCGAEVTTKEEVHCLAFFEKYKQLDQFQCFIDKHLPFVQNKPGAFGYQAVVDENDQILEQIESLLITGLDAGIEEVEEKVHELEGLFIPAHIDRPYNSLIGQLGLIPPDLNADAFEVFRTSNPKELKNIYTILQDKTLLKNSDAHYLHDIGIAYSLFQIEKPGFAEIKDALKKQNNRNCRLP